MNGDSNGSEELANLFDVGREGNGGAFIDVLSVIVLDGCGRGGSLGRVRLSSSESLRNGFFFSSKNGFMTIFAANFETREEDRKPVNPNDIYTKKICQIQFLTSSLELNDNKEQ